MIDWKINAFCAIMIPDIEMNVLHITISPCHTINNVKYDTWQRNSQFHLIRHGKSFQRLDLTTKLILICITMLKWSLTNCPLDKLEEAMEMNCCVYKKR